MNNTSIGVAIITRNRIEQLKRLLPQLTKLDQVVICDTGSKDGTEKYIRSLGKPFEYIQFPWLDKPTKKSPEFGFAAARNASFAQLKTTHAIWLDTDDVIGLVKGNKETFASAEQVYGVFKKIASEAPPEVDVWFVKYVYSRDVSGNPNTIHTRERMVKLSTGWRWVYPVHECLTPSKKPVPVEVSALDIIHMPTKVVGFSSERNMKLLQTWLTQLESGAGDKHDLSRCRLNIGETLYGLEKYKECANWLVSEFIRKHPENVDIERWHAWAYVAKSQFELRNFDAAKAAALAMIDIEPGLNDGYFLLAQVKMVLHEDPQDVLILIDQAGRADEAPSQMITNPLDYSFTPFCIVSDCKFQLGQFDSALEFALKAQKLLPRDDRAETLRLQASAAIRKRDAVESAKAMYRLYLDFDENEKASKLYDLLPYVAQQDTEITDLAKLALKRVRHLYDRNEYIKFYAENNLGWMAANEEELEKGYGLAGEKSSDRLVQGDDRYQYILSRLKQALPNGGRILDVGCSDGFHSLLYAKQGYEVVGIDLGKEAIELANKRAEKWNLPAKFVTGFFEELEPTSVADPFDVTQNWFHHFDAVVCGEVIEHVQDPAMLLGCLGDCAKDNAPIILTTPDESFDKGDTPLDMSAIEAGGITGHVRVYTQDTFEVLLKSNPEFSVVESRYLPFSLAYRERQGWQVGEIRRVPHANGPVIRIYCGNTEPFCPSDVNTGGIGGSETAVIQMAKAWADMGCQVVVYSNVNGIYDGVFYRNSDRYDPTYMSDVFISWRVPTIFANGRPNAKTTIFWVHDIYHPIQVPGYAQNEIPQEWVDQMDYVMVLSEAHKKIIERMHPTLTSKTLVTRNGIDPLRYLGKDIKKVPHKYFYSSSYDRGLEELLEVWPQIKTAIPDAELHVAYGTQVAEHMFKALGEGEKLRRLYISLGKMKSLPGVIHHERIGQQELADIQLSCEAWLYPYQPNHESGTGGFIETYCITALEAQAARCKIVSRKNGALPETIKHAIWWDENTNIVESLQNLSSLWEPKWTEKNYQWAINKTWDSLATEWAQELSKKEIKEEVAVS
jgi:2-polyprenyl-3-methyl-5-hydroxy-6-metoxy-1,4-benzoquinol methylase/glycosyltransferase involved in cell wall biosynthesis